MAGASVHKHCRSLLAPATLGGTDARVRFIGGFVTELRHRSTQGRNKQADLGFRRRAAFFSRSTDLCQAGTSVYANGDFRLRWGRLRRQFNEGPHLGLPLKRRTPCDARRAWDAEAGLCGGYGFRSWLELGSGTGWQKATGAGCSGGDRATFTEAYRHIRLPPGVRRLQSGGGGGKRRSTRFSA